MISLHNRKSLVLGLTLILIGTLAMLGVPKVHAVGNATAGVALSAQNCGSPGLTCPGGVTPTTDTSLAGVTVKSDTHIKFANTTNTQTTWNIVTGTAVVCVNCPVVYDTNNNNLYDSGELVIWRNTGSWCQTEN